MKLLRWSSTLCIAGAVLAGCGNGADSGGKTTDSGGKTTASPAAGGATAAAAPAKAQELTVAFAAEPSSLDPALAADSLSGAIDRNIFEGLVRLDAQQAPTPALATKWAVSADQKTVTFTLRSDARWTNGRTVTASDFEYAWKRVLDPELASLNATKLSSISGADAYSTCKAKGSACDRLRDAVAVDAVNSTTLKVVLKQPTPWFLQLVANQAFLPVPREVVEKAGRTWTEPKTIVTNGPFKLTDWKHDASLTFVKNPEFHGADSVKLTSVRARVIPDGTTAVQAFEAGDVDVVEPLPPAELARLRGTKDFQSYEAQGTYSLGFSPNAVPDVNQRRAMALAIDRQAIVTSVTQGGEVPASGYTPKSMPGSDVVNPQSPYLNPATGSMDKAKELMKLVKAPKTKINYLYPNTPGNKELAIVVQAMWKQIGIDATLRGVEEKRFFELLLPKVDPDVDVFRISYAANYPDPHGMLDRLMCGDPSDVEGVCIPAYDKLISQAARTADSGARSKLYHDAEVLLFGPDGTMPLIPLYWLGWTSIEKPSIRESYSFDPSEGFDWSKVVVTAS